MVFKKSGGDIHLKGGCHPYIWITLIFLALAGCGPTTQAPNPSTTQSGIATEFSNPLQSSPTEQPTLEPPPAPKEINPLTGLPVTDASLLDLPALLVSISHFPVTARPQAGLSFAPYVFEVYITEGATRFLATFYGEFPVPEAPVTGGCEVRREIFTQIDSILGNRVWFDANEDGMQDAWERGVGGVCVNLYGAGGNLIQQTSTDSNGYYGFNVSAGSYFVEFLKPAGMEFTRKNAGDEEQDSDADQASGRTDAFDVASSLLHVDAGLLPSSNLIPASDLPPAKIGPIRSGRLVYADIAAFFTDSCLIYAFASSEVLVELPQCFFVHHDIQGGGYMLEIDELKRLARERENREIEYTSNAYDSIPPEGGMDASQLHVYIAWLNQSGWRYDPLSESWWRFVDDADAQTAGVLHPEVDRLTNRQLQFENVIVLFAQHDVVSPTNLDIHLEADWVGDALLFRDGQVYDIRWGTRQTSEELKTGIRKPIQFLNHEETALFPLKPGRTWILVVTPLTAVIEKKPGEWLLQFSQPPGAK
jgi:hypothetical protein